MTPPPTEPYRDARTVDDLTERNIKAIVQLEQVARAQRGPGERMAQAVASFCGTTTFVWWNVAFFAGWIAFNAVPGLPHPDPYPYTFLTLVVSLEAILLSSFILISQNEEARIAERRNALDLQINLLTEQENTKMLQLLVRIARRLQVEVPDDGSLAALEQATRPERLAEQIDRAAGGPPR
jgi:uncharacterized membrane protein